MPSFDSAKKKKFKNETTAFWDLSNQSLCDAMQPNAKNARQIADQALYDITMPAASR